MLNIVKAKSFFFLTNILLTSTKCYAKHIFPESVYQSYWCNKHNGIMEYVLDDNTRVDCLTDKYAVEVDFAKKWAECIGQSIHYGNKTNKQPACVLILENPKRDTKYLRRLRYNARKENIKTFTIKPDKIYKLLGTTNF